MLRTVRSIAAGLTALACLWPVAITAQDAPPSLVQMVTTEQARTAFVDAGYQVDQPVSWEWTSPPVSTFHVQDTAQDRIVMVLVYPTSDAAELARTRGPNLVVGYGESVWRGNVALVETTQADLNRVYRYLNDRSVGMSADPRNVRDPGQPSIAVDLDFLQALDDSVVSL